MYDVRNCFERITAPLITSHTSGELEKPTMCTSENRPLHIQPETTTIEPSACLQQTGESTSFILSQMISWICYYTIVKQLLEVAYMLKHEH